MGVALLYVMLALDLNIVVGFAPLKPAEFVVLHFRAQTLPPVEPIDWV